MKKTILFVLIIGCIGSNAQTVNQYSPFYFQAKTIGAKSFFTGSAGVDSILVVDPVSRWVRAIAPDYYATAYSLSNYVTSSYLTSQNYLTSSYTGFDSRYKLASYTPSSLEITTALGFTPYNATNPSGYISSITSGMVTTALGYTPYNTTNPSGYISSVTSGMVTTALGYTPYNGTTNPNGYTTTSALTSGLSGKENTITAGTISQYWRGDKTWQTLNTDAVTEGTNQYFTNNRARASLSLTTTGSGAATYDNSTGVLNVPTYAPVARSFTNSATKTINGTGVQLSTTRDALVSYTVTHAIALTLVITSGASTAYLEISSNNSTWTTISSGGYSDGVAVAVVLNKSVTTNLQGVVPSGWYVRIRAVTSGGGSASYTNGQEVLL